MLVPKFPTYKISVKNSNKETGPKNSQRSFETLNVVGIWNSRENKLLITSFQKMI